jgi:hypothetical protein
MMEDIAFHHIPTGTVFQLDHASPYFCLHVDAFLDREFPDHWIGTWGPIPWATCSPDCTLLHFFFFMYVVPTKYFPVPGEKQNIALKHVIPLVVPILSSTEHIRNLMRCSV